MQGSSSPGISHDGGTHEQESVKNRCVAPPSCKVQGSGSFIISCCQADVCERDLGRQRTKEGRLLAEGRPGVASLREKRQGHSEQKWDLPDVILSGEWRCPQEALGQSWLIPCAL